MKKRASLFLSVLLVALLCTPSVAYASLNHQSTEAQQAVIEYLEQWSYSTENGAIRLAVDKIPSDILSEFLTAEFDELDDMIKAVVISTLSSFEAPSLDVDFDTTLQPYSTMRVSNINEAELELIPFTSPLGGVFNGEVMGIISMTLDYTLEGSGKLYINSISSPSIRIEKSGPVVVRSTTLTTARVSSDGQQATVAYSAVLGYVADFIIFEDVTHSFSYTYRIS